MNFVIGVTLALGAFSMDGEYQGGGQHAETFNSVEECVMAGYNMYQLSPEAWDFQINPSDNKQFAILYPDGSVILGECEEQIGI